MDIGKRIKQKRLELGLTIDELAKKLNKNRATVYRYENNDINMFPLSVLSDLAKVLNVSPAYLMGWEDCPFQLREMAEREIEKRETMIPIESLSIRLGQALKNKNIEIFDLSQRTSISETALNRYLSGCMHPSDDDVWLICRALGISQDWLMGYDVPMDAKHYSKSYELSAEEECIIAIFRNLNKSGQDRLLEYSMELKEIAKYVLKSSTEHIKKDA